MYIYVYIYISSSSSSSFDTFLPLLIVDIYNYIITSTSSSFFDPIPLSILKKLVNTITPLFSTIIIDLINKCVIPNFLKSFLICPIIKIPCLDYNYVGNFKPISMLPIIGQLFENNISEQVINCINDTILFDVYKSVYKKGHNTETTLLATTNDIYFYLDKHSHIQLFQFNLLSAFDSISHNIIINRLPIIG